MTDPDTLSRRLADVLIERGTSERVVEAMHAVPRHLFIPDRVWLHERGRKGNDLVPLDRANDPDAWMRLVYSDTPINTQVDDGKPDADGTGREVSSSSSQPVVMAEMLDALCVQPGDRVLEIGSGTGWNAAILAHLVGAANVTTVELDPLVAAHARQALDAAGCTAVSAHVGDGAVGWPHGAPFDKVISTVGVSVVPWGWVEQTVPEGRIVAPLTNTFRPPGIVALACDRDSASGRLAGPAAFMALRSERTPRLAGDYTGPPDHKSTTDIHPHHLVGDRDAATTIGQRISGIQWVWQSIGELGTLWLYGLDGQSWATVELSEEPPYLVEQAGPRRLFDEVEQAYRWWEDAGSPEVGDWLVTVAPGGQRIGLAKEAE